MQAVPPVIHFGNTTAPRPAVPAAPPTQFGNGPLQGLLEASGVDPNKQQEQRRRKNGKIRKFLVAAPLLTLLMVGIYPLSGIYRQGVNRYVEGKPLESVLVESQNNAPTGPNPESGGKGGGKTEATPEVIIPSEQGGEPTVVTDTSGTTTTAAAPVMTTKQLIQFLNNHKRLNIPAPMLPTMAKAGLLKEVIITNQLTREGIVILINGKELQTKLDDKVQTSLIDEHNIPVNKPFLGWLNFTALEATLLSALIAGMAAQVLTRDDKIHGKLNKDDKKRIDVNDLGRFMVAQKLDTSDEPITLEDIESQRQYPWLSEDRKPLTRDQLKNQLAVLWAGYFAEKRFYDEKNLSITSMNISRKVSEIASLAVAKLDAANIFGRFHPQELSDELKQKVEEETKKLAEEAATLAEETINAHPIEHLEVLLEARHKFHRKPLSLEETTRILEEGKSVKEIRSHRRRGILRAPGNVFEKLPIDKLPFVKRKPS